MTKDKLTLLIISMGFLFLVLETRHSHAGVWVQEPLAFIPVIACSLGFLACIAGLAAEKKLGLFLGWFLIILSSVGAAGVYLHTKGDLTKLQSMLNSNIRQERLADNYSIFNEKPLLAPMSISGLSLVGGVAILGNRRRNSSS